MIFPLNAIHHIPVESPKKMVALSAAAYLTGAMVALGGNLPLLTATGIALYGTFRGIRVSLLNQEQIEVQKTAHAAFLLFSALSGASLVELIGSALHVKNLSMQFFAAPNPHAGLHAAFGVAFFAGTIYPISACINRCWFDICRSIEEWGGPVESFTDYTPIRNYILTSPDFHQSVNNSLQIIELINIQFHPPLWIHHEPMAQMLFDRALSKATDQEIEQIAQLNYHEYPSYFTRIIQPKIEEILHFCHHLKGRIDQVHDRDTLEKLQTDLVKHTQNALRILANPPKDQPLDDAYRTYLINNGENPFREAIAELSKKYTQEEMEEDILYHIPNIFRETDCHQYVKEFGLKDIPGMAYTQIFHQELERLGLATLSSLKNKGFDHLKGTDLEKKEALIALVKKVRGPQALQLGNIIKVAKMAFFEISVWSAKAIGICYQPSEFCQMIGVGYLYSKLDFFRNPSDHILNFIDTVAPTRESFAACETIEQHANHFAAALFLSDPLIVGYKTGFELGKLDPFFK